MYLLFSQLKKYLPDLTDGPKEVAGAFTKIGYMLDKFYEVQYQGQTDFLLDLEVRQNRADCFGVLGLARELSAYYNIPLALPEYNVPEYTATGRDTNIAVEADKGVKRLLAVEIEGVYVGESPAWLKEYLAQYKINSINNLVDFTNYVMLETGHASHAFDRDLLQGGKLTWKYPVQNEKFTTLNGEEVEIDPSILSIADLGRVTCLTFIGGKEVEITQNSKNIILEMAVYEGGIVRQNSRKLNIITEAGSRLEKYLDPETMPLAFDWLVSLILENCGGTIVTNKADIYLDPTNIAPISLDLNKLNQLAGIEIPHDESEIILNRLGFQTLEKHGEVYTFKSATNRLDVTLEEDLIEEVIRIYGYDQIPVKNIQIESAVDITPKILGLIDTLTVHMAANGYNEVRSWVLVSENEVQKTESDIAVAIKTTNSINEEVPYIRPNLSTSLWGHFVKGIKNNLKQVQLFEVGKVFRKVEGHYTEHYALGLLRSGVEVNSLFQDVQVLVKKTLGDVEIRLEKITGAEIFHPSNTYAIKINGVEAGILAVTSKLLTEQEFTFAEINIQTINEMVTPFTSSMEITSRIADLDINIPANDLNQAMNIVAEKTKEIRGNVYATEFKDEYKDGEATKYTFRISYINLEDSEAKALHERVFA